MIKARKKWLSILLTVVFLMSIMLPAGIANAATTYSALTAPTVAPDATDKALGTILIKIDTLGINNHKAIFSLPKDFDLGTVTDPAFVEASVAAGLGTTTVAVAATGEKNEFRLDLDNTVTDTDVQITVALKKVDIPADASGDIMCTITGLQGQLTSGEVKVGVASTGRLDLSMVSVPNITSSGTTGGDVQVNMKENAAGALEVHAKSLKLTLPSGFEWDDTSIEVIDVSSGTPAANVTASVDGTDARKLYVECTVASASKKFFRLKVDITVDESVAKFGDVVATIGGESDYSPSDLVVAKYVDFGVTVNGKNQTTVTAGRSEQEVGDFYIEEAAPGSLINGRTLTLKLPANAKWYANPTVSYEKGSSGVLGAWVSVDARTIKSTISGSASASKILIKDGKVLLAVDTTGDLAIEVGGTAGATGSVVVANIVAPVTASAASTPDVKIGEQSQAAGDIVIIEGKKEAIDKVAAADDLVIEAPTGVQFATVPTVTVTDGDLTIDKVTKSGGTVVIEIKGTSSKASTITVSNIKFTVDRTVPVGPIELKIKGEGVNKTAADFANATVAAKVVNANCVTPAPGETKSVAVFKVGDATYTVNGVEQTMDAAAYIESDRCFIPLRYAAYAAGVSAENILYSNGKVTIIKGDKVVQLTIGSNAMVINGITITMDVNAVVKSGRTMLPVRWVAQALGCTVTYDATAQTVTVQ